MSEVTRDRDLVSITVDPSDHDAIFSPATLKLGEMHWYLLRAASLMDAKTHIRKKVGEGSFITHERTDFGDEVGRDEINWWVFRKETDIDGLRERTRHVLDAAQVLKEASAALKRNKPAESYAELLNALRRFAEDRAREIELIYEYTRWLGSRDALAPAILFTYRVWGSTRRGDRWPYVDMDAEAPDSDAVRHLTAVVLGLISRGLPTRDDAYYEIGEEIWSRMDVERMGDTEIEVPMGRVVARASRMAYDECAVYFEELRDSLRNIQLDIEKFVEQRNLVSSEVFWKALVEKAIRTRTAEPQLWDFKQTLPIWHIPNGSERERAKVTFAEDVASFANARGGVLIVGVNDRREVVGVGDVDEAENRLKFASEVLHKHLEYARPIFRFHQLVLRGADGHDKLCLLVIAAQACEVVGVNDGDGHYTYPVRRETGIHRESRYELMKPKMHMKSDNYDFLSELNQFAYERSA